ncbi:conserved hypothetical protein [Planktothrix serta PCC 8927]|uniref:Uncharacterized protein n=1 Tax=Planktothrix serta PCC 8927 TaxID=671068 RepID=A0A7Z9C3F9_9CYAN|nr:hypothetical protein [Planktothrix serta]VXD25067.1 conserved hypothetical protein [Planktothrix serta PCC 8927]
MANNKLETRYQKVFDLVYPQIKDQKNGVLYKVIHILLEARESEASEICNDLDIKDNASLDDDENVVVYLIDKPNAIPLQSSHDNWLKEKFRVFMNPNLGKIAWIVIIACFLVGVPVCIQYINKRKQKLTGNTTKLPPNSPSSQELPPITAALCLVVQASVFIDLKNKHPNALEDNRLSCYDVKMLIDYSSHFLCIGLEDVASIEEHLEITREEITNDSNQEVYIRIHIDKGQNLIGKQVPYILKRDLPSDGQRIIQRYNCLKNLSGLEHFNHI